MSNKYMDSIITLRGREFKRVKNGLDEAEVASFIDELIKERDELSQSKHHIASLNRLAERTVVEADKLAAQVKTEAVEQAKAESAAIMDKAKEQARQLAERQLAESMEAANAKADEIKAKAKEEAAQLLDNEINRIREELRNIVNQQFDSLLEELENLKQRAAAVQTNFNSKLSQSGEEKNAVTAKISAERGIDSILEVAKGGDVTHVGEARSLEEYLEPGQATTHAEKGLDLSELLQGEEHTESGNPQWEVEILPPFEIGKIMEFMASLDQLPEVANTEMIVPQIDMPSILVFLRESINFVDVLKTIPAVAYVEEVTTDTAAVNGNTKKVRIGLSKETASQEQT